MKNIALLLVLSTCLLLPAKGQTNYHHYYDSTSELKAMAQGVSGFWTYYDYYTTYFDGDTLIGSNWYYREYTLKLDSSWGWNALYIDTTLSGPYFIREDSTHKVWRYDDLSGMDVLRYDWGAMPFIGDTFQYTQCIAAKIDSVYLGTMALKRVRPANNFDSSLWTRGDVEGIGRTFLPCATGIEYNYWIACCTKQGSTVFLSKSNACGSSFLKPVRTHHYGPEVTDTGAHPTSASSVVHPNHLIVWPNPVGNEINIHCPLAEGYKVVITDALGQHVMHRECVGTSLKLDVSGLLPGRYAISMYNESSHWCSQFVKE